MRKLNPLLKRGLKAVENGDLVKVLQTEIRHEISHPRFHGVETGSLGDFKLDWDSPESQDIVLKRQFVSGEEVVVSALLQPEPIELDDDLVFPREALAKVCIKKPGISSILQFHCRVYETGSGSSHFDVEKARFIRSLVSASSSTYRDNFLRPIDFKLGHELRHYLISKGISEGLTNFIVCHLNKKEQDQYVNWLRKLESTMSHSPKP
ncbi:unnamed protein product [Arabidopsis arenosa]|uniref:Mitochondrial glycoprotein family protein n=1 Tax=Arabidopsis arenosa TaxID=38785 RepID=A0A8S2AAM1_ARAAE|nr:unnamed protein product [Arabidopsis arenosa]